MTDWQRDPSPEQRRPNPWAGATIIKLSAIRTGAPLAFFDVREAVQRHAPELLTPLLEGRDEYGSPLPVAPGWERGR